MSVRACPVSNFGVGINVNGVSLYIQGVILAIIGDLLGLLYFLTGCQFIKGRVVNCLGGKKRKLQWEAVALEMMYL